MSYSVIKPASIRTLVAAEGGQAFQQRAGERRRRASSLQLASPPVATRNGLACLLLESAILTHRLCYRPINSKPIQNSDALLCSKSGRDWHRPASLTLTKRSRRRHT